MSEKDRRTTAKGFTLLGFFIRFGGALLLVLLTYNPSSYSYFHWVRDAIGAGGIGPLHFIAGVVLVIGWVIFLYASFQALNILGIVLLVALLAGVVWLLVDMGILHAESVSQTTWIVLVCVAFAMAVGVSWSHIWRRLTGQYLVDDVDD